MTSGQTKKISAMHVCAENITLKERVVGSGTAYVHQCQVCGEQVGHSLSKTSIQTQPEPFDNNLSENFYNNLLADNQSSSSNQEPRFIETTSDTFEKVIDDAIDSYIANSEGRIKPTKSSLINSYITRKRESYLQGFQYDWESEDQIKEWFISEFSQWFTMHREVRGIGQVNGKKKTVIIDFVLVAKPELINEGFTADPIGVEAKFLKIKAGDSFTKKASIAVFQALSYSYSNAIWDIPELGNERLACVLMLSNLSFKRTRSFLQNEPSRSQYNRWRDFLNIASNANVGEIIYHKTRDSYPSTWRFDFAGGTYFSYYEGGFKLGKSKVINKERIGNTQ